MKKFTIFFMIIITIIFIPTSVFAKDYNVTNENERNEITNIVPGTTFDSSDNYKPSIGVNKKIKSGDTIYFENTKNWSDVKIYIFEYGTNEVPDQEVWPGYDMTNTGEKINNHDIYSYKYEASTEKYDYIVFSGIENNERKQTIDFAFLDTGSYLSCSSEANGEGKYYGNWYIYDKSLLEEHMDFLSQIDDYKDYIDEDSYNKLTNLYNEGNDILSEDALPITYYNNGTLYISEYVELLYKISNTLNNIKFNASTLEDAIENAEKQDTSKVNDRVKEEFEDLIEEAKMANTVLDSNNPYNLTTKSTIEEINNSNEALRMAIDEMNILITKLNSFVEAIKNQASAGNNITNPSTDNYMVNFFIILLSAMGIGTTIYIKKKHLN